MSSDSDDDCYDNIAQKLQKMKNKYQEDKIESTNLLDDSTEIDKIVLKSGTTSTKPAESPSSEDDDLPLASVSTKSKVSPAKNARNKSKRTTRSTASSSKPDDLASEDLPPTRSSRRGNTTVTDASENTTNSPRGRVRGRGRGRGRIQPARATTPRTRGRGSNRRNYNTIVSFQEHMMPTYSIGDADEVYDMSRNQALFSSKPNDVVLIEDNDPLGDNEELSVKVYWQSCEFVKFTIRKYQKLAQIFDYFVKEKKVDSDKLLFTYNERILKPDDTPDSIDYNIVKFIDGGVVNQSISHLVTKGVDKIKDGVKLKFQCQNVKKPIELVVRLDDKFHLVMMKCAEHLEVPLSKLKFEFDGDSITGKDTAREMELEGGECIDVKIVS